MTRYRATIRGDKCELRGYFTAPTDDALAYAAQAATPFGLLIASPVENSYNPFTVPMLSADLVARIELEISEYRSRPRYHKAEETHARFMHDLLCEVIGKDPR